MEYLESLGWLGADVWFAHGIHLDDRGIAALAASGSGVAHCPSSNARLGAGMARIFAEKGELQVEWDKHRVAGR